MEQSVLKGPDYLVIGSYLFIVALVGLWVGRGQKTSDDYFLAGRSMRWFPIGISTIASIFSAISYMGHPSEYYAFGMVYSLGVLTVVLAAPVVIRVFMPFYHNLKVDTAYEYLEKRFSVNVRSTASVMFIFWRVAWMATATYVPALVLHAVTGMPLIPLILIVGAGATFYTVLGGIRAVIWTDMIQFAVFFGGTCLVVFMIVGRVGGLGELWAVAKDGNRVQFFEWSLDPTLRLTTWSVIIGSFVTYLGSWGADQVSVQRFLTARTLKDAQASLIVTVVGTLFIHLLLILLGLSLFAFYASRPDLIPPGLPGDRVYPFFLVSELPIGFAGLMIAAILAAAMSSIDSGLNSCTSAVMNDFVKRFRWLGGDARSTEMQIAGSQRTRLRISRGLTLVLGVVITTAACFVDRLGTIIEITNTLTNSFAGPMLGLFLLGMLTRRADARGVLIGLFGGSAITLYFMTSTAVSFRWYGTIGLLATLLIGYGVSVLGGAQTRSLDGLVFRRGRPGSKELVHP